ncbi:MAG TPA: AMP-binding protein, partial [Candidatus Limnocylindrales bacterium]|nr:AMP-binding protein [Candidatus Limnocylindrales bacterium]
MDTLIDLVRAGGERHGDRPALLIRPSFRTRVLTHRDLTDMVPRVARGLREAGLEPGDRAVIWAVNRPEWGLAFLAVAHAGGVAVPIDVRHTVDFGTKIVEQTRPKLVLASKQTEASARAL